MSSLCPSCREPLDYPSGDGCAAMTRHKEWSNDMSHWHYQLMKHTTPDGEVYYAVHEYYELETGPAFTHEPVTVDGCSVDDVKRMLLCILKDLDTHGVVDYE